MKSPAFQIYPADFLADANTLVMSAAEVGAYWLLLCVCWRENGLPDDVEELAAIARTPAKQFQNSWDKRIQRCFVKRDDGKWTHKRLQIERDKQTENRGKRQVAGSKGAAERWQTDSKPMANASHTHESANGKTMAKDSLSSSSSISSSTSISHSEKEKISKPRDARLDHPALIAVRDLKGRFPTKDLWDMIIETLGDAPDIARLKTCWREWRTKGFRPDNYAWLTDWYANGTMEGNHGTTQQRNGYETAAEKRGKQFSRHLAIVEELRRESSGDHHDVESGQPRTVER